MYLQLLLFHLLSFVPLSLEKFRSQGLGTSKKGNSYLISGFYTRIVGTLRVSGLRTLSSPYREKLLRETTFSWLGFHSLNSENE